MNIFSNLIEDPPSLVNPFICILEQIISYDEDNNKINCYIIDDAGNKIIGFLYDKFAEIASNELVIKRIPFKITIYRGKITKLGETLFLDMYQVIFEKNILINSSAISGHQYCPISSYLSYGINTYDKINVYQIFGLIFHDYLSYLFEDNSLLYLKPIKNILKDKIKTAFEKSVFNNWELISALNIDINDILNNLNLNFLENEIIFVMEELKKLSEDKDQYEYETEKMIRSKNFGLKGRIDRLLWNKNDKTFTLYETKTGRSSASSEGTAKFQLISYSIILREYYPQEMEELVLEYPRNIISERLVNIDYDERYFLKLLSIRNEIWEIYIGKRPEIGPYLHCGNCFMKNACSFYCFKEFLNSNCIGCQKCKFESILVDMHDFDIFKLSNTYYDWFFSHLNKEYQANLNLLSEIKLEADERESLGNCISNMVIMDELNIQIEEVKNNTVIEQEIIGFTRDINYLNPISGIRINENDFVIITPQNYKPLTVKSFSGYIYKIENLRVFIKIKSDYIDELLEMKDNLFRIDLSVSNFILDIQKKNLDKFIRFPYEENSDYFINIRNILINSSNSIIKIANEGNNFNEIKKLRSNLIDKNFNPQQIDAIIKSLRFQGLLLIHGPPGTGKTTTIVEIIFQLISRDKTKHFSEKNEKQITISNKNGKSDKKLNGAIKKDIKFDYEDKIVNKKILISAYTNKAVDNVTEKVAKLYPNLQIVRLGNPSSISPNVLKFSLYKQAIAPFKYHDGSIDKVHNPKKVRKLLENADIIACTCLGADTNLLTQFVFDYVIIDEAGQIIEPAAIIPILKGKNLILVGDDKQLPPISQDTQLNNLNDSFFKNKSYLTRNNKLESNFKDRKQIYFELLERIGIYKVDTMSKSIFQRLNQLYGQKEIFVGLKIQYRMNNIICDLASELFYNNSLISSESVSERTIIDFFHELNYELPQFTDDFDNFWPIKNKKPLIFLDTSGIDAYDSKMEEKYDNIHSKFNMYEANLVVKIIIDIINLVENYEKKKIIDLIDKEVKNLKKSLLSQIGIIAPYRAQIGLIRKLIEESHIKRRYKDLLKNNMIIDTVDKFQGNEKEIIIISLVDSNPNSIVGEIHKEIRRLNVSITRAKSKLIIIGNINTYCPNLKNLIYKDFNTNKKVPKDIFDFMEPLDKNNELNSPLKIFDQFFIYLMKNNCIFSLKDSKFLEY